MSTLHRWVRWVILAASLTAPALAEDTTPSPFATPEPTIVSAPATASTLGLATGERLVAVDVSPLGPETASVVRAAAGAAVRLWTIGGAAPSRTWRLPAELDPMAIAWHPSGGALILLAKRQNQHEILVQSTTDARWRPRTLYRVARELRGLAVGPRPFGGAHRIYFGERHTKGFALRTVTDAGAAAYTVIAPKGFPRKGEPEEAPEPFVGDWAVPVAFHPAGHILLWQDARGCLQRLTYGHDTWSKTAPALAGKETCGGALGFAPNGAALLRWLPDRTTQLLTDRGAAERPLLDAAVDHRPLPTPDGRGLVTVRAGALHYEPVALPLADVVNAWMFTETPDDAERFARDRGLFRRLDDDQLHALYESELYACKDYDTTTPTRPYLVTTDVFWEVYAAAFEGLFVLTEQRRAMPAFWAFAGDAATALARGAPDSRMAKAFATVIALRDGAPHAEADRVRSAAGIAPSDATGEPLDFSDFKPRGHYQAAPALERYFAAFRYLAALSLRDEDRALLATLPPATLDQARAWVASYTAFVAPPRAPLLWDATGKTARYARRPIATPALYPLGWGIDNEALDAGILHTDLPPSERVEGRLLPSGLDVALVLGNPLARTLLRETGEFARHANLEPALDRAVQRVAEARAAGDRPETLYDRWLAALGVQWADSTQAASADFGGRLWAAKRLQTGLASWATLRHATLLVNERTGAECGEAGFETIELRPPRGYVEPDPAAFEAVAGLFEATRAWFAARDGVWEGRLEDEDLKAGVVRRLTEARDKVRLFAGMAEKQRAGTPLSAAEYEEILYLGRVAEHNFLVFKSLAAKDFALSNPEPMAKLADIAATAGVKQYAAVGRPLEWDQVVPFFGRRQIVKGAVYGYHEFSSPETLSDGEWRGMTMVPPDWIAPFIASNPLSCPPLAP